MHSSLNKIFVLVLSLFLTTSICQAQERSSGANSVLLTAHNINFYFVDGIGFYVKNLVASFIPLDPKQPVNLDDSTQFMIQVHSGEVIVPPQALTALFNNQILDYWPRPLNNMRVSTGQQTLCAHAGLRLWCWFPPIFWIPASLKGNIVLNQNLLIYTPYEVNAFGIPIAGVLNALGIKLTSLITLNRQGANLVGNSLILDFRKVFPPPALSGELVESTLTEQGLSLKFSDGSSGNYQAPRSAPQSYIWIKSGDVKLFNIVMLNTNILIQDFNNNILNFDLYGYRSMFARKNVIKMEKDGSMVVKLSSN